MIYNVKSMRYKGTKVVLSRELKYEAEDDLTILRAVNAWNTNSSGWHYRVDLYQVGVPQEGSHPVLLNH